MTWPTGALGGALALAVLISTNFVMVGASQAKQQCRDIGSATRPIADDATFEIQTPNGPFRFREASRSRQCERRAPVLLAKGLMDASGRRVLVPAAYDLVFPISDTLALVGPGGQQPYRFYEYGVGERGVSPYFHVELVKTGSSATVMAWTSWDTSKLRRLFIFAGKAEPVAVDHVQGFSPLFTPYSEVYNKWPNYLLTMTSSDGQTVSRLFDGRLRPISPVIGAVEVWRTAPAGTNPYGGVRQDIVSHSMRFRHPLLPYDGLYIPISPDGLPLPMPAGAIGVFPLKSSELSHSVSRDHTYGWAIVFATPSGFEIASVQAPLQQALREAPTAPRYLGMRRGTQSLVMVRDQNGWRTLHADYLTPVNDDVFETAEAGFAAADLRLDATIRQKQEVRTAALESRRQEYEGIWTKVQSGETSLCSVHGPNYLPGDGLERFFRECPVERAMLRNLASLVSDDALAIARTRTSGIESEQAEAWAEQEQARLNSQQSSSPRDAWAQGLAAAHAAVDSSFNAFTTQQNAVYQRNLQAWNNGAQNWGYDD